MGFDGHQLLGPTLWSVTDGLNLNLSPSSKGYGAGGLKTSSWSDGCFRGWRREKHGLPLMYSQWNQKEPAEACQTCHPCAKQAWKAKLSQQDTLGTNASRNKPGTFTRSKRLSSYYYNFPKYAKHC